MKRISYIGLFFRLSQSGVLAGRSLKLKALISAAVIFGCVFYFFGADKMSVAVLADEGSSSDAIAIRVMPNPGHLSPLRWYSENVDIKGAPQSLVVDGYQAVRDGRTVYVNAANVIDNNGDGIYENYYSNIYIISYNQDADQATMDILGQILDHWKFNVNLMNDNGAANKCENIGEVKSCSAGACPDGQVCEGNKCVIKCLFNKDCPVGGYCLSKKARLVRDTIRLSDLAEIKIALNNYYGRGYYPKLESGTYLKGRTISVWPSWQENFAGELGLKPLMVDPVNKLGPCSDARFKMETCWDEEKKEFDDPTPGNNALNLPAGSKAYYYELTKDDGSAYRSCTNLESDKADFIPTALSGEDCISSN
ncbi:MAG: hypothetical protein WC745_02450 [Patescibacteria group bacterium]|jgi:hypothetical protein